MKGIVKQKVKLLAISGVSAIQQNTTSNGEQHTLGVACMPRPCARAQGVPVGSVSARPQEMTCQSSPAPPAGCWAACISSGLEGSKNPELAA